MERLSFYFNPDFPLTHYGALDELVRIPQREANEAGGEGLSLLKTRVWTPPASRDEGTL